MVRSYVLDYTKNIQLTNPPAKDLIARLLDRTPEDRYSAAQALAHPWVQSPERRLSSIVAAGDGPCSDSRVTNESVDESTAKATHQVLPHLVEHS